MSGTAAGVEKTAAARVGVSVDEYRRRQAAGEKWCWGCRAWHPLGAFPADRSRGDGRRARCLAATRGEPRTPRDPAREAARAAVGRAVRAGRLANPNDRACVDCGHLDRARRHEYDHHAGYGRENWLEVEPVCTTCHADRERERRQAAA